MCNCSSIPANICNQCAQGNACGCPPDYTIQEKLVECGCCPAGYGNYQGPTRNYPNGTCTDLATGKTTVDAIACPSCEQTLSSDCVIIPKGNCYDGGTVTDLANYICSEAYIESLLIKIGKSVRLGTEFCQLVSSCPPVTGGTRPVIGSVTVRFP
jgi:hypothetical protein